MYTVTTGRPDFPYAQEIAQAPLVIDTQASVTSPASTVTTSGSSAKLTTTTTQKEQLWFNQRTIVPLPSASQTTPLQVEVKLRTIYELTTETYTGLYLGGSFEDYRNPAYLQNLQTTGTVNLDSAHLAKMFVLKKLADGTLHVGLYEHEGLGWIVDEALDPSFATGWPIYHLKAQLNNNQLTLSVSRDDTQVNPWTRTVTVTPTDQRMFGVICSGTAIEWDVLQPTLTIIPAKVRSTAQSSLPEVQREISSLNKWAHLLAPTFGNFTLQALSRYNCMNGAYIYTTTNTGIMDNNNKPLTDYVVFASHDVTGTSKVGMNPVSNTVNTQNIALVSIATGNVYDATGTIIGHQNNVWTTYNNSYGPLPNSLAANITTVQQAANTALLKATVGVFNLEAADPAMIANGQYIYSCTQTLTDKSKNPITDYLIVATLDDSGKGLGSYIGAPPSNATKALLSLVTGYLYAITSTTLIDKGYTALDIYQASYQTLPASIVSKINNSAAAYQQAIATPPPAPKTPISPPKAIITGSITSGGIAPSQPASTGTTPSGTGITIHINALPATSSISSQQHVASGGISFKIP
jgi:hypothetical protein